MSVKHCIMVDDFSKEEIQDSVDFANSSENPKKSEINQDIYEMRD